MPSAVISFGAYELIQKLWLELEAKQDVQLARAHYQQLHTALSTAQRCNQHIQQLQQQGMDPDVLITAASSGGCGPCQLQQDALLALSNSGCDTSSKAGLVDGSSGAASNSSLVSCIPCGSLACSSTGMEAGATLPDDAVLPQQGGATAAPAHAPSISSNGSSAEQAEMPCAVCVLTPPPNSSSSNSNGAARH